MTHEPEPSSPAQPSEPDVLTELLDKPFADAETSTTPTPPAADELAPAHARKRALLLKDLRRAITEAQDRNVGILRIRAATRTGKDNQLVPAADYDGVKSYQLSPQDNDGDTFHILMAKAGMAYVLAQYLGDPEIIKMLDGVQSRPR